MSGGDRISGGAGLRYRHGHDFIGKKQAGDHGRNKPDQGTQGHEDQGQGSCPSGFPSVLYSQVSNSRAEVGLGHQLHNEGRRCPFQGITVHGKFPGLIEKSECVGHLGSAHAGEKPADPAHLGQGKQPQHHGNAEKDDPLDKIRGNNRPGTARCGIDYADGANDNNGGNEGKSKDGTDKDPECPQLHGRPKGAKENAGVYTELLRRRSVTGPHDIGPRVGAGLAVPWAQEERAKDEAQNIGPVDDQQRGTGLEGG